MSNLSDVVDGCVTTLKNNITGLQAYSYAPDSFHHSPAAAVVIEGFEPQVAFGGNTFEGELRIRLYLVAGHEPAEAIRQLYDYIDPTVANKSVIKAIRADKTLNGKVDDADVDRIENIGWDQLGDPPQRVARFDAVIKFIKTVA